jgi:hypothetical protein
MGALAPIMRLDASGTIFGRKGHRGEAVEQSLALLRNWRSSAGGFRNSAKVKRLAGRQKEQ